MNPLPLLLTDLSPALRYRALLDLGGRDASDHDMQALRDEVGTCADVRRVLRRSSQTVFAQAYQLCQLGYLGLRRSDRAVDSLAEPIFAAQATDGSWSRQSESYEPIETGLVLRGLAAAGYATDSRTERGYEWLIECRLEDGTWAGRPKAPGSLPRWVPGYRKLPESAGCRTATTSALAAFALHPERRTSPDARAAVDVLMRRQPREEATLGHEVSRLLGVERAGGYATFYAVYDPAFVFDLATRIGMSTDDPRMAELRDHLDAQRGPQSLWSHPTHPHLTKWLTVDLAASMRRLEDADWEGSGQHVPFTAYPRRPRRY